MKNKLTICSACGFKPSEEDVKLTNYKVATCDNCGSENVCDLCLRYAHSHFADTICPHCYSVSQRGRNRRFWLQEEYEGC